MCPVIFQILICHTDITSCLAGLVSLQCFSPTVRTSSLISCPFDIYWCPSSVYWESMFEMPNALCCLDLTQERTLLALSDD